MDFQSRINQFRQNMDDQQKNFNSMASSAANFGRTVMPDKTAQHYAYMEKVAGMTTGSFAALHGAKGLAKRVQKYRKGKQDARNNKTSQQDASDAKDTETKEATDEQEASRTVDETAAAPDKAIESLDIDHGADAAETAAKGGKLGAFDRGQQGALDADDAKPSIGSGEDDLNEAIQKNTGLDMTNKDLSGNIEQEGFPKNPGESSADHIDRYANSGEEGDGGPPATAEYSKDLDFPEAGGGALPGEAGQKILGEEGSGQRIGAQDVSSVERDPKGPGPNQNAVQAPEADVSDDTGVLRAGPNLAEELGDEGAQIGKSFISRAGGAVSRAAGAVSDTVGAASDAVGGAMGAVKEVAMRGAAKVIGEGAAEVAADAVPFVGEAVGLGLLIANIVKGHKHEENAGPPKLTAATAEPTEQAGGIDTSMLKMNVAPTIS